MTFLKHYQVDLVRNYKFFTTDYRHFQYLIIYKNE